jgi:hypothetical protein
MKAFTKKIQLLIRDPDFFTNTPGGGGRGGLCDLSENIWNGVRYKERTDERKRNKKKMEQKRKKA